MAQISASTTAQLQQQCATGAALEDASAGADEGAGDVSTALGTIKMRCLSFARYRVCIEPTNPRAQEIIAARLSGIGGWHQPGQCIPYFTKIFSMRSSEEALAAVKPSMTE